MNTITLDNILPHVFASTTNLHSEVWLQKLTLEKGKTYLIEADSGMGKSTFCSYLIGHRHDYTGRLLFDEHDAQSLSISEWTRIRQRHISYLFQELRLFPELTSWENVLIKNRLTGHATDTQISAWFDRLGITDKMHERVGRMSFGQQQRVALIRALCQPFDFLLADEPISHLDDQNSVAMGQLMLEESRRQEAALIVTSIGKHMALPYDKTLKLSEE